MKERSRLNNFWIKVPFAGICIFLGLYVIAACLYPGGSQADISAKGFSWINNYWCDLLSEQAKNGLYNTARPVAVVSWLILCFSLSVFWYFLPRLFLINVTGKKIIQFSGVGCMLITSFLFTSLHDVVIHIVVLFGFIALSGAYIGFYSNRMYGLFYAGVFCMFLMGMNYYIMLERNFVSYLPLIQKITFAIVLVWMFFINRKLWS